MSSSTEPGTTNIFVSYSHRDRKYVGADSLLGFLNGLERDGARFWHDKRLNAGDLWDEGIRKHLLEADVALVLVSQWLLDSVYVRKVEVRTLLERISANGLTMVPVILSPCEWKRYGWLAKRQHLPAGDKTIATHYNRPGAREGMYTQILERLRGLLRKDQAELAIEAMSGAVNMINSLEPQYRTIVSGDSGPAGWHSLHFEGLGSEVRISRHGVLEKTITAADIRHLEPHEIETITTMQRAMRQHYETWFDLYRRQNEPQAALELSDLARKLRPDLLVAIDRLEQFGLDLEDHYRLFYQFLEAQAGA